MKCKHCEARKKRSALLTFIVVLMVLTLIGSLAWGLYRINKVPDRWQYVFVYVPREWDDLDGVKALSWGEVNTERWGALLGNREKMDRLALHFSMLDSNEVLMTRIP